jgi:hypothetical protein
MAPDQGAPQASKEGIEMARRADMYHRMTGLSVVVLLAAFLPSVPLLAGCSANDPFVTRHCAFNANPHVSANRVVTMVAVNYIYSSEASGDYTDNAPKVIPGAYEAMNKIFRDDGINLQIASLRVEVKNVHPLNIELGFPDITDMIQVHHNARAFIGVHWPEWEFLVGHPNPGAFASAPCASESCNYLSLAGQLHINGSAETLGKVLARTFGLYFNLEQLGPDPTNLMGIPGPQGMPGPGTKLTIAQRNTMWSAINSGRPDLTSETCDPPAVLAPRLPKLSPVPGPLNTLSGTPTVRGN